VKSIAERIAEELGVRVAQVEAAIQLLDDDATVPFIARYRKEATGGLDDTQLRTLEERLTYLRELEERRQTILDSIRQQKKLTTELEKEILAAETKTRLEDLYLPYRPKRRTKAQIAREKGLEPLADAVFDDPRIDPAAKAAEFVDADKGVADADEALEGARSILIERFSEDAELVGELRDSVESHGVITAKVVKGKEQAGAKFSDYFDYTEPYRKIPSHRALALLRARNEGVIRFSLVAEPDDKGKEKRESSRGEGAVCRRFGIAHRGRPADDWLVETARRAWREKILAHLEVELVGRMKGEAEEEAIRVFAENLRDLLLAAPAGSKTTIGLDPGLRTGVKVAIVDGTGKLIEHSTIFPHAPRNSWDESIAAISAWIEKHSIELIAIGNGTASRETERLVNEVIKKNASREIDKLMVSEAGASVYSASELAAKEFPNLDVSFRGAVSIARRLQDPLAELVKIEPKSIGVGQYQHDVDQRALGRSLGAVVEDCVNAVGVDVNTASAPLLARVSGINKTHAQKIVSHRDENGPFAERKDLLGVSRFGAKAFELSAGFLRIQEGTNPLDRSAVHPEAYPVVERLLSSRSRSIDQVIGDRSFLRSVDPSTLTDEQFGVPTVSDILEELEKPGRDPRPEFKTAEFLDGVETLEDLDVGMTLEGVVTNVTNFGAFVDVGVHQDGLVHVSAMSHEFVRDPHGVVKAGEVVKVRVMEVDLGRRRIALSMRLDDVPGQENGGGAKRSRQSGPPRQNRPPQRNQKRGGSKRGGGGRSSGGGGPKAKKESSGPTAMSRALDALFEKAKEEK